MIISYEWSTIQSFKPNRSATSQERSTLSWWNSSGFKAMRTGTFVSHLLLWICIRESFLRVPPALPCDGFFVPLPPWRSEGSDSDSMAITCFELSWIYKKKTFLSTQIVSKKNKIWGTFFCRPGKSVTWSYCRGIVETNDKISALTWEEQVMFNPFCG